MTIRAYLPTDWDIICSLWNRAKPIELEGTCDTSLLVPLEQDTTMQQYFNKSEIFVLEDTTILGFCGLIGDLISWMYVDPEYARQGFGTKMLDYLVKYHPGSLHLRVGSGNAHAINFYLKHGFILESAFIGSNKGARAVGLKMSSKGECKEKHLCSTNNNYTITSDLTLFDMHFVCSSLQNEWRKNASRESITLSFENSLCFGLFNNSQQIGFVRVISDYTFATWVFDLFVAKDYRGKGLGAWLMESVAQHPDLISTRLVLDATAEAEHFYASIKFTPMKRGMSLPARTVDR